MRTSGWFFIVCLLSFWTLEASELSWDSEIVHQNSGYRLSHAGAYRVTLMDGWQMNYTGTCEQRNDNDQLDKLSRFDWRIGKKTGIVTPSLIFRFDRSYERDDDSSSDYSYLIWEKTAGIGLELSPVHGVALSTNWSYARLDDRDQTEDTLSDGLLETTTFSMDRAIGSHIFSMNAITQRAGYHPDRPDYDSAWLAYGLNQARQKVATRLEVRRDNDRLNQTVNGNNRQYRKTLASLTDYSLDFGGMILCLRPELRYNENRIDGRPEKNYASREGDLRGDVTMPFRNHTLYCALERELADKDAELSSNSEETDLRAFETGLHEAFGNGDSLVVRYRIQLRRTDIPDGVGTLDNDRLSRNFDIGLYVHRHRRIRLSALFSRISTQQVFIHGDMSGQNTVLHSYNLQPTVDIDLGGGYYLGQYYYIRADYEDYQFTGQGDSTLFRRFQGRWRWGWDESPGLTRVTLSGNGFQTRPGCVDPWSAWLEYEFTVNSSGIWADNAYEIDEDRMQHIASGSLRKTALNTDFRLGLSIAWVSSRQNGKSVLFRRETRPELELHKNLGVDSETSFLIQPVIYGTTKPDWRFTFRLTIRH